MNKYLFTAFTLSGLLLNAQSQDSYKLDRIYTTGATNYKSEEVVNHPGSKSVISSTQLQKGAIRSVDEALQRVPGVQIKDYSGIGVLPKISVRGFGTQGNSHSNTGLILLDGIPIYGAPYSNIELAVFPITLNMIDRIEVTKGASSIWAGPNTFGGVVNIISKEIPREWESEVSEKITWWQRNNLFSFYRNGEPLGNNMLYDTYLRTGGYLSENFGLQAQANIIKGQGFRYNTPQSVQNYKVDSIWNISENQAIKSYIQYYDYFSVSAGALARSDYEVNPLQNNHPYDHADGMATRAGITYILDHGDENNGGEFNATYYYSDTLRNLSFDSNFNSEVFWTWHRATGSATYATNNGTTKWSGLALIDNPRRFIVNGVNLQDSYNFNSDTVKQNVTYGIRLLSEALYQQAMETPVSEDRQLLRHHFQKGKDPKTANNYFVAPFISYTLNLSDKFSINPALRYDFMNYNVTNHKQTYKDEIAQTIHEFSAGLNMNYKLTNSFNLFVNYNKSFLPQQYGNTSSQDINYSQHAHVGEFGFRYNNDDFTTVFNYFAVFVDNQSIKINGEAKPIGRTLSHGFEADLYYNPSYLEGLTLHLSYTFIDARKLQDRQYILPSVSPHQGVFDISYNFGKTVLAYSSYFYSNSFSDEKNLIKEDKKEKTGVVPGYYVANIQISRPLYENNKNKILGSLGINNVFNQQYWFRGDGTTGGLGRMPAPSRSVVAQIRYLF